MSTEIETINNTVVPAEVVVSGTGVLDTLERASIDMQIATAHQFPRSATAFKQRAITMATYDDEVAASCLYCRPVGKDEFGKPQYANGMSVRMAEIVAACYGNLRVAARIIEIDPRGRYVVAQGVAHDLETNYLSTSEVIEATVKKNGKPYDERMRIVVCKAALAKARRDAIFHVVPKAMAKPVELAVRKMLAGESTPLVVRRQRVVEWLPTLGIDPKRVWAALGVVGVDDLTEDHFVTLNGLKTAMRDGDVTIDEAFPELEDEKKEKTSKLEKAASALKAKAEKTRKENAQASEKTEDSESAQVKQYTIDEIVKHAEDSCQERGDYIALQGLLGNYISEGKLDASKLEEARKAIADVAAKNGIKL